MPAPCRSSPHSAVAGDELVTSDPTPPAYSSGGLIMSTADRRASDATDPNVPSDQNASSVRTTISRKKHAANRRNARRSTGPRTETGKKTSSRNAVTHALFCRDLLVRGEPREQLLELRESLRDALAPADAVEHGFVDS